MREAHVKTEYQACRKCIQKTYVGRLEGIETLTQRLVGIKQRQFDKSTQQANYRSVQELSQEHQRLLAEMKPTTLPTEIPQLDNVFVQAASEDLRKKLLIAAPLITIYENIQRFTDIITLVIKKEEELKMAMNIIAERAVHRSRPYGGRGTPQCNPRAGPRTFLTGTSTRQNEDTDHRYDTANTANTTHTTNTNHHAQLCGKHHRTSANAKLFHG
jgi:hypothetical protein